MPFLPERRSRQAKDLMPAPQLNDRVVPYMIPPGQVGKPYRDQWDMKRAVEFGLQTNIWVMRCVNLIADTQARLPMVMRKNNPIDGPYVDHPMLDLFNFQSSPYESALIFRKRISQILLLNKQGVAIEVIYNRVGGIAALYILPPGYSWPIPHPKTFISAWRIQFPGMSWVDVEAENVIWIRNPHPTDPYSGQTPLEAAGLDIETDYYQRLFRRNFLMNDGRPGGVLLVKGQIDDVAAMQLRQRFQGVQGGGFQGAGRLTVMEADAAQYVDMSQTARDSQYVEGAKMTRDAILEAFGCPESMIGNASARTFSNAEAEQLGFWQSTELNHLDTVARALDALDPDPSLYIGYDLSRVSALQLPEVAAKELMLKEVAANARAYDEYRIKAGMMPVGGGAAKLRAAATMIEVADVTAAEIPDWEQNPNAFNPSLVTTGWDRAEFKGADDPDGVLIAVVPPPDVAARVAAMVPGCDARHLHVSLAYLGSKGDWDPGDLGRLEGVVAGFCRREAPVIAELTGTGQFVISAGSEGRVPTVALVSSAPLNALRDRLMAVLAAEGLRPRVPIA